VKDSSPGPSSLLQEFTAQQHANVFLKAFSFATTQLPRSPDDEAELSDGVLLVDDIGFIYHLKERGIERKLIPYCQAQGIALVGYTPFGKTKFPRPDSQGAPDRQVYG